MRVCTTKARRQYTIQPENGIGFTAMEFLQVHIPPTIHLAGYEVTLPDWITPYLNPIHPIAVGVIIGIGMLLLFLLWRGLCGRRHPRRACRWHKDMRRHGVSNTR